VFYEKKNKLLCEVKGCYGEYDTSTTDTSFAENISYASNGTLTLKTL